MTLITGLTGLVGSGFMAHLCQEKNYLGQCVALCRESSNTSFIEPFCHIVRGSSWDERRLDEICEQYTFDTLIHISNKCQLEQFALLAVKHKIKRVIMVSSTYACSRAVPDNNQLKIENRSALILEKASIDYIFLRPTAVFGTRPDGVTDKNVSIFTRLIFRLPLFPLFARGKATVRPVWGKDVGLALLLCVRYFDLLKNKRLICAGDKTRTFKDFISTIAIKNHRKIRFVYFPGWLGKVFFELLYVFSLHKKDYREAMSRLLEDRSFDTSSELCELGYRATEFVEALQINQISIAPSPSSTD